MEIYSCPVCKTQYTKQSVARTCLGQCNKLRIVAVVEMNWAGKFSISANNVGVYKADIKKPRSIIKKDILKLFEELLQERQKYPKIASIHLKGECIKENK